MARTVDNDLVHMGEVLRRAATHRGTAFVEVFQNCAVFNDGAYAAITGKATRQDSRLQLEHGKPMVFGKDRDKGIRLRGLTPEVVTLGEAGVTEADLLIHDETQSNSVFAYLISQFEAPPCFPVPIGVFRALTTPTYDELNIELNEQVRASKGRGELSSLLNSGETWTID